MGDVENAIATIAWQAGNLVDNLLGTGIPEGTYKLACYGFKNNAKKYLKWDGTQNHQLNINSTGTIFFSRTFISRLFRVLTGWVQPDLSSGHYGSGSFLRITGAFLFIFIIEKIFYFKIFSDYRYCFFYSSLKKMVTQNLLCHLIP